MKTSVDISDPLFEEAKKHAVDSNTTLRELIEQGLRLVLDHHQRRAAYTFRDASVPGNGLQPEFRDADWERIRDAAYEGGGE